MHIFLSKEREKNSGHLVLEFVIRERTYYHELNRQTNYLKTKENFKTLTESKQFGVNMDGLEEFLKRNKGKDFHQWIKIFPLKLFIESNF